MMKYLSIVLLLFCTIHADAQLCQGSLGDPLINITFGSGSNPGPPLAAAATGYQFVGFDCPSDGFYTVTTNSQNCFQSTWHTLNSDHTGNANGYFMLVNAALTPSAFYIDTVKGLCGSSTYEFAAWVLNIIKPDACGSNSSRPNLTFSIEKTDGTILQSYNSQDIQPTSSPVWNQYGFFFTSPPAGADIVLRIVNNAAGGCGNDLALDDITFRPCGPRLVPSVANEPSNIINICEGTTRSFTFSCTVSPGFTNPAFQWQQRFNGGAWSDIPGANAITYMKTFIASAAAGTYDYRLSVAEAGNLGSPQCRISSQPITIIVNPNPVVTATATSPACAGTDVTLSASGASTYSWTGPQAYASAAANPVISNIRVSQAGSYNVTGTSAAGCAASAVTVVQVNPSPIASTATPAAAICMGDSVQLNVSGGTAYEWQPSAGLSAANIPNPKASPAITTSYQAIVTNQFACSDTAGIVVNAYPRAIANAGPDKILIQGLSARLEGSIAQEYQSFFWTPNTSINNVQLIQPVIHPAADISYILHAESKNGCGISTDTVFVKVYKDLYIPSAFTPNGDAINPTWNIPALSAYASFELNVYNRYGQIVFQARNANRPWDGKFKGTDLPIGAYPYVIKLNGKKEIIKGTVMLLR